MEYQWWLKEVRLLPTSRYDRWAFECCNVFSQQVMLSTECNGTHGNDVFVLSFTRYMGQSNFISRSMEGLYFGKKCDQVNAHATNLCYASLPGGGFRVLHDQVKTLIITFLRLAGVEADEESALWMLGQVRDPYMKRYIDWLLRAQAADKKNPEGAIVADFVARDFPTATQASNDSGIGSKSDVLPRRGQDYATRQWLLQKGQLPGEQACQPARYKGQAGLQEASCQPRSDTCTRSCRGWHKWSGRTIRGSPWNSPHRQRLPHCCRLV